MTPVADENAVGAPDAYVRSELEVFDPFKIAVRWICVGFIDVHGPYDAHWCLVDSPDIALTPDPQE